MKDMDRLLAYVMTAKKAALLRSMITDSRDHYEGQAAAYQDVESAIKSRKSTSADDHSEGEYLLSSDVIDTLYQSLTAARIRNSITDERYLRARDAVDGLAQTFKDGTTEP